MGRLNGRFDQKNQINLRSSLNNLISKVKNKRTRLNSLQKSKQIRKITYF